MPSNFQRLRSKQPWKVTETTANAIIASAEDFAKHHRDAEPAPPPEYHYDGIIIEVRNDSGAALNRFSVVGLDNALISDADNLKQFQNYPRFSAVTPRVPDHVGCWGVLVEPLDKDKIGKCLVAGVVPVQVRLATSMENDLHAHLLNNVSGYLQEGEAGNATILHSGAPDTGGLAWCLVRLPQEETIMEVRLTTDLWECGTASAVINGRNPDSDRIVNLGTITIEDPAGILVGNNLVDFASGQYVMRAGNCAWVKWMYDTQSWRVLNYGSCCEESSSSPSHSHSHSRSQSPSHSPSHSRSHSKSEESKSHSHSEHSKSEHSKSEHSRSQHSHSQHSHSQPSTSQPSTSEQSQSCAGSIPPCPGPGSYTLKMVDCCYQWVPD